MQARSLLWVSVWLVPALCSCDDANEGQHAPEGARSSAAAANPGTGIGAPEILEPNPVYPIVASIEGNAALQEAAAGAAQRSAALDELCKTLVISPDLAARAPATGGCPRLEGAVSGVEGTETGEN